MSSVYRNGRMVGRGRDRGRRYRRARSEKDPVEGWRESSHATQGNGEAVMTEQIAHPTVVSPEEWQAAREALLAAEKQATRAYDALNAERRRLPMLEVDKDYVFDGPEGRVSLLDCTPYGRQEDFEDSPAGWPQRPTYG